VEPTLRDHSARLPTKSHDFPEVAGKAVITFRDEKLVLDSGNDGQTAVGGDPDDAWLPWCDVRDGSHFTALNYGGPRYFKGFHGIAIEAQDGEGEGEGTAHVAVFIDADWVSCATPQRTTYESPFSWTVSVAACDLESDFAGNSARLEEASFRVKSCREDGR
jgi:hypothetical protein